MRKLPYRRIVS